MKNLIPVLLLATVSLIMCKSDPANRTGSKSTDETLIGPTSVHLLCKPVEDPNMEADAPRFELFVQLGDNQVKVADILNCESLSTDSYEQYQIPANALSAVGGWWGGAGDYFYVIEENGQYVVKQGDMDEGRENNDYGYKTILRFAKNGRPVL